MPEWLERLKTDYYQRRISSAYLQEIHEVAIKAALKDQEKAGVEIVSDGELRRDNDLDYFLARIPGVEIPHLAKAYYYDYFDAYVRHPLPARDATDSLGLVDDLRFTLAYTDRPVKFQEVFATLYTKAGLSLNTRQFDLRGRPQYLVDPGVEPIRELV